MATKTIKELLLQIQDDGLFESYMIDPLAQFETELGALLGARLLPEQLHAENSYKETQIRWKTRPALDNNRYSPTQMQTGGRLVSSFNVDYGYTDTQSAFDPKEYDDFMMYLNRGGDEQAIAAAINWAERTLLRPHTIKNEIQRWQALLLGTVERLTVDGQMDPITYYQEPGHKVWVPGGTVGTPAGWHSPTYSILGDLITGVEKLEDLGYQAVGMYATPAIYRLMRSNEEMVKKNSTVRVDNADQLVSTNVRMTEAGIATVLLDEELPPLTTYNTGYESINGFKRYMNVEDGYDYLLIAGSTTRNWDMAIDYQGTTETDVSGFTDGAFDNVNFRINNVLGYHGIGRNAGQAAPGRTVNTWVETRKPGGLGGESYQTGLPVIQDPQAYYVIRVQQPTA